MQPLIGSLLVGFNTQPPEGGCSSTSISRRYCWFQHTATRRWLLPQDPVLNRTTWFQHTATRRWLPTAYEQDLAIKQVSTHSHPKVAAVDHNKDII